MHKSVTHDYFLDEMQMPDVAIATQFLNYAEAAQWAQTRQIMLCSLKPYLKKKNITAEEFLPLPTDEQEEGREITYEADPKLVESFLKYQEEQKKQKDSN